jgi:FMN phosphatase YigB (HAD superfamily)
MISFVYFDLGGVVELDFSGTDGWNILKKELGVPENKYIEFDQIFSEFEQLICTSMDVEELKNILNKRLGIHISPDFSLLNAFVTKFERNPSIWPVIKEIHQNTKIGLFTMMYPGMLPAIYATGIMPPDTWDIIIDSSVVRRTKYDDKLYKIAMHQAQVPPEQILYIENSQKYIEKAKGFGWQTFLYDPKAPTESSTHLLDYYHKHLTK